MDREVEKKSYGTNQDSICIKGSRVKSGSGVMDAPIAKLHDALAIQLPSNSQQTEIGELLSLF